MKNTVSVNLAGQSFVIDDDAHGKLKRYLDEVNAYFSRLGDDGEAVRDIETRVAELVAKSMKRDGRGVVEMSDVDEAVAVIGTVADMRGESDPSAQGNATEAKPSMHRRLYRNPDDVVLAGVCSGLAAYLGVDPLWVRLVFLVSIFFGGVGVFVYLILWIIMPVAVTEQQKLEMRGEEFTLESLRDKLGGRPKGNENVKAAGTSRSEVALALQNFVRRIGQLVVTIVSRLLRAFSFVIGLVVLVLSAFAVAGLVGALVAVISGSPYVHTAVPLWSIVSPPVFYALAALAAWLAIVPVIFFMMIGLSLLLRRSVFRTMASLGLMASWLLAAAVIGGSMARIVPAVESGLDEIRAGGTAVETVATSVTSVDVSGIKSLTVVRGDVGSVEMIGPQAGIDAYDIYVADGALSVRQADDSGMCLFCDDARRQLELVVVTPDVTSISATTVREISVTGFEGETLAIGASHADVLQLTGVKLNELVMNLLDVDMTTLSGEVTKLDLGVTGFGGDVVDASGLVVGDATVRLSQDSAEVTLSPTERLSVTSNGLGHVTYSGTPEVIEDFADDGYVAGRTDDDYSGEFRLEPRGDGQFVVTNDDAREMFLVNTADGTFEVVEGKDEEEAISDKTKSILIQAE